MGSVAVGLASLVVLAFGLKHLRRLKSLDRLEIRNMSQPPSPAAEEGVPVGGAGAETAPLVVAELPAAAAQTDDVLRLDLVGAVDGPQAPICEPEHRAWLAGLRGERAFESNPESHECMNPCRGRSGASVVKHGGRLAIVTESFGGGGHSRLVMQPQGERRGSYDDTWEHEHEAGSENTVKLLYEDGTRSDSGRHHQIRNRAYQEYFSTVIGQAFPMPVRPAPTPFPRLAWS